MRSKCPWRLDGVLWLSMARNKLSKGFTLRLWQQTQAHPQQLAHTQDKNHSVIETMEFGYSNGYCDLAA